MVQPCSGATTAGCSRRYASGQPSTLRKLRWRTGGWSHPTVSRSDQPNLNRPAAQLVGRVVVVAEAIEGGRGKVRVGDTLWPVEGPDTPAGIEVRVRAAKGTVLVVERA